MLNVGIAICQNATNHNPFAIGYTPYATRHMPPSIISLTFPPVLYFVLKKYARLAIRIYCRRIIINEPKWLKSEGPLLLACNHPNSFLDGIILTTLFEAPVYSLARGDAFNKGWADRLLRKLQLLPVYRTSEGVENLGHNYATFDACRETFLRNGIVLIFSEGRCENEWHLRPLKKGTARLAVTSWEKGIPLKVVPTVLNYSSFRKFGKEVHVCFGAPIEAASILAEDSEGKQLLTFNKVLHDALSTLVYEIHPKDRKRIRQIFSIKTGPSFYFLLLPALTGFLLHAPLFYLCKLLAWRYFDSGHYDSVFTGYLLLLYPFYLVLLVCMTFSFAGWWSLMLIPLSLFTAWAAVQVKYQADI